LTANYSAFRRRDPLSKPEGELFLVLLPAEILSSFFFASSWDEKRRDLTLLAEDGFRLQLTEMGLPSDEVDYLIGARTRPAPVGQIVSRRRHGPREHPGCVAPPG
jgi:hypothetical protein